MTSLLNQAPFPSSACPGLVPTRADVQSITALSTQINPSARRVRSPDSEAEPSSAIIVRLELFASLVHAGACSNDMERPALRVACVQFDPVFKKKAQNQKKAEGLIAG